jgi:predicted transcriptional regulator
MHEDIDIGTLILDKLKENGQAVSWLAKKVNTDRSNFYRILKRNHIDTDLLMDISRALNFDFFACYSEHFQKLKTENK